MFSKELASTFKGLISSFKFRDAKNTSNARREFGREGRMGHGIFEGTLGIGGEETYCRCGRIIERIREENFARLEPLFVHNMFFGRNDKPDGIG